MAAKQERLLIAVKHLVRIRNESSCAILSECGVPDITVKQIGYLKVIDQEGDVTFTRLAAITQNSKPTITETVNRFVQMGCVYRERSPDDARILYIRLTEKGRQIARAEEDALSRLIERMIDSLDENEMAALTRLLRKIR